MCVSELLKMWGRSIIRYYDGLQKHRTGMLTLRGMTKFWSGLRETRRSSQALFPGKGRRFKSGQPHHKLHISFKPCIAALWEFRLVVWLGVVENKLITFSYCWLWLVIRRAWFRRTVVSSRFLQTPMGRWNILTQAAGEVADSKKRVAVRPN